MHVGKKKKEILNKNENDERKKEYIWKKIYNTHSEWQRNWIRLRIQQTDF